MATVQTRPFSRNYSGLVTQSILAGCIGVICLTAHDMMKRVRRGKSRNEPMGSVESWEFGYLYQGRSWAKIQSPLLPRGWPLLWAKQALLFPESRINEIRGVDAALYCRFLKGCLCFAFVHTLTTTLILLPIHLKFSDPSLPSKSMDRALISSLVSTKKGLDLLWIHLVLMAWVSSTWMGLLYWLTRGVLAYRSRSIEINVERAKSEHSEYSPHPHPQHPFHDMPPLDLSPAPNQGLRLRTVMVTNIPVRLRTEKELKEYFEFYMSRPLPKPALGLTSPTQPGLINKLLANLINRLRRKLEHFEHSHHPSDTLEGQKTSTDHINSKVQSPGKPRIERVVLARRMTELASLLDRREEALRRLEAAHIKLAKKVLGHVKHAMKKSENDLLMAGIPGLLKGKGRDTRDVEKGVDEALEEERLNLLVKTLGPFVERFGMLDRHSRLESCRRWLYPSRSVASSVEPSTSIEKEKQPESPPVPEPPSTVWEALFSLPRETLDHYQPLVHLSHLFRGKTVPAVDYYTTKVSYLTSLITEGRSRASDVYEAVSTAFVTFANPDDAKRACRYLAVHPTNPLACIVTMAPDYEDLDWVRIMKSTFEAELLKDWVVDIGVWAFTIAWIIPVSLLVALVSIQNIASVLPGLQNYLNRHHNFEEFVSSLLPTLLVSLLMLLIPVLLLLIAKKAHTINSLSALHDRIMTRYHKFLVVNILIFFCVGVTAVESFFTSFKSSLDVLQTVGESFPSAGPFYVGWFIFATAMHGGIELALLGLPLMVYPSTKRQLTPRKRSVGIRPRTFNYYYWLPNHVLIVFITLVFSILNPLLMPFAVLYFSVQFTVIKNQLIHVYAKNYEGNGSLLIIRIGRYTLDGLILAQGILLAFFAVVKKDIHVAFTAVMIATTVVVKLVFTHICRLKFEEADLKEARIICKGHEGATCESPREGSASPEVKDEHALSSSPDEGATFGTWKLNKQFDFSYSVVPQKSQAPIQRLPIPFEEAKRHFTRVHSYDGVSDHGEHTSGSVQHQPFRTHSLPVFHGSTNTPESLPPPLGIEIATKATLPYTGAGHIEHSLVTVHEKVLAWDDSSRFDRPYDNPYYVRPIENHLWLPRDPVNLLNLDDTVNVFRSLTSDSSLGQLGEWLESGIAIANVPPGPILPPSDSDKMLQPAYAKQLTGGEHIVLPPAIATRVESLHKEDDIEYIDDKRPSFLTTRMRRSSNISGRSSVLSMKKQESPVTLSRSVTASEAGPSDLRPRSSYFASGANIGLGLPISSAWPTRGRMRSGTDVGAASHRVLRIQSKHSLSQLSLGPPSAFARARSRSVALSTRGSLMDAASGTPVTTREAVVGEVIAEEEKAAEDRQRQEDVDGSGKRKSRLFSWMFSRQEDN